MKVDAVCHFILTLWKKICAFFAVDIVHLLFLLYPLCNSILWILWSQVVTLFEMEDLY